MSHAQTSGQIPHTPLEESPFYMAPTKDQNKLSCAQYSYGEAGPRLPVASFHSTSCYPQTLTTKTTSQNRCTAPHPPPRLHLCSGTGGRTDHKHGTSHLGRNETGGQGMALSSCLSLLSGTPAVSWLTSASVSRGAERVPGCFTTANYGSPYY